MHPLKWGFPCFLIPAWVKNRHKSRLIKFFSPWNRNKDSKIRQKQPSPFQLAGAWTEMHNGSGFFHQSPSYFVSSSLWHCYFVVDPLYSALLLCLKALSYVWHLRCPTASFTRLDLGLKKMWGKSVSWKLWLKRGKDKGKILKRCLWELLSGNCVKHSICY